MANTKQQQDTPETTTTASGVEIRPMYTGIVQGRLEYGTAAEDIRAWNHGETFTTHDKALFDQLRGLGALKLPEDDVKTAQAVIDQKQAEIETLRRQVEEMTAAAMQRGTGGNTRN